MTSYKACDKVTNMNRLIKFRVWDVQQNKFLPSYADKGIMFYHEQGKDWHEKQVRDIVPVSWFLQDHNNNLKNYIVAEYTGLNDSDDVPIYEGDIVKYNPDKPNIERIGVIEFSDYYNGWGIKDSHCYPLSDFGQYSLSSPFLSFNYTEIVGNIFEHAELLK